MTIRSELLTAERWITYGGRSGHILRPDQRRAHDGLPLCGGVMLWHPRRARDDEPTCQTCAKRWRRAER